MKPTTNSAKRGKNQRSKSAQSGEIRIIGGQWRGRKLKVHDKEGLRPTTDRLKETVFNWLMTHTRDALVLDCFAGAGSLGFEAASRHAKQVYCIEKDKTAASQLTSNVKLLGAQQQITVLQGDFFTQQQILNFQFDLIFIDPPFNKGFMDKVVPYLIDHKLIATGALVYIEQETTSDFDLTTNAWSEQFEQIKNKSAGQVSATLYRFIGNDA
ncbi:16S rRNA (guanine(966)-N(2))-methyltransferase RsmD [Psychrosphaera sp. 1_MG-2023]|uniref:Ribosomal RNA small subunit methyltransferase D n=1 Tax=Psychrosphaera algicola TaxID=3023714 RepID=A0ABT5FEH9_9GAMM|nr:MULTISPECIES: 16S rRNA (guanine(966)-N(2))-methyltransferase RsmD [unclassified Psychrosphaera]MDC2889474.1 16S rRNA (guanine(966)-N(2))-methyltransferase RsmD [Psychrosphaera sp. G1-22]MDO6718208.1 16S rRNA (guanine(966)-N(2))-methyltransferase RsmD [Psychrosphaera sp. 1_MG-2023]